tara:strand:- start:3256 stop:4512 length:1257 start_codon:yes stop_codon:yes gene_type:complete
MGQRAEYLLQFLDKIGSPIMQAIIETSEAIGDDAPQEDATALATMLGRTVQASMDLGEMMDINPLEIGDDSLRVALTGLASPLVASQMLKKGEIPSENDIKRIVSAMQAAITFADNFTPDEENTNRLANLKNKAEGTDEHQTNIQYVLAFTPIIEAVSIFAFGQKEQKLIGEISNRIIERAEEIRALMAPELKGDEEKAANLAVSTALAKIYASCHRHETKKAINDDIEKTKEPTIDDVWDAFDLRASMLEALAASILGGVDLEDEDEDEEEPKQTAKADNTNAAAASPLAEQAKPTEQNNDTPAGGGNNPMAGFAKKPSEQNTNAVEQPAETQETSDSAQTGTNNPMSMFAKKPTGDQQDEDSKTQPESNDASSISANPMAGFAKKPAEQSSNNNDDSSGDEEESGGGPMSFFKKGG